MSDSEDEMPLAALAALKKAAPAAKRYVVIMMMRGGGVEGKETRTQKQSMHAQGVVSTLAC